MKKGQVVFIHGGDAFRNEDDLYEMLRSRSYNPFEEKKYWRTAISDVLADTHDCISPRMPNANWADYTAWSIWFEKVVPYLDDGAVLVGHSLGGGFLLRYLSENELPIRIAQLHLVSPVVTDDLGDTDGFAINIEEWSGFKSDITAVHLWHSEDDSIVPIAHSEQLCAKYQDATLHRFIDRFHFIGEEFPELLAEIQKV